MKLKLLVLLLLILQVEGYAQKNKIFGVFAGGGIATANNYDVSLSGGLDVAWGLNVRSLVGLELLYQQYSVLYDNEALGAKKALGTAGEILRHKSAYMFISPKFRFCLGRRQNNHFYFAPGIGFNAGGYDSLRRWSTVSMMGGLKRIDTTIDQTENINSMVLRVAVGATQYLRMGEHWRFSFTEDFGVIPGSLTKTSDYSDINRSYLSQSKVNPAYVSIRIGISHTRLP
jgi:hypothetical protein